MKVTGKSLSRSYNTYFSPMTLVREQALPTTHRVVESFEWHLAPALISFLQVDHLLFY